MRGFILYLQLILLANTGCGTIAYYSQAIKGQCQMLCCHQSVRKIAKDNTKPAKLRKQMQLVLNLREYAHSKLGMNPGENYLRFKRLNRKFALWVVYAAPEFDTRLKSWWYPVAGRFTSRGWFSEKAARRYAESLAAQGLDVHVGGAPAYSTLGWFDDPVLDTFINYSESDLAELIFHELAHGRFFLAGDATFNESFATATARAAVFKWLKDNRDTDAHDRYRAECLRHDTFIKLVLETRQKLDAIYISGVSEEMMRTQKVITIENLRNQIDRLHDEDPEYSRLARWAKRPLNNANLAAIAVYNQNVSAFSRMHERNDRDFRQYFEAVESLAKIPKTERELILKELEQAD